MAAEDLAGIGVHLDRHRLAGADIDELRLLMVGDDAGSASSIVKPA